MSIAVFKYDNAVKLLISLTDGGKPYKINDGNYAIFYGKRADGEPLAHPCMIRENTEIIYEFQDTTACVEGIVDCQIRIYGRDNKLISAPIFIIVVEEQPVGLEDIEIESSTLTAIDSIFLSEVERKEAERERNEAEKLRDEAEKARQENRPVINITSIDTTYETVADLPTDSGNGATYLVSSEKALYAYNATDNVWGFVANLQSQTLYNVLTGAKSGIYRYTMASPYLVSAESHTLEEAKEYTDAEIAKVYKHIEGLGTGGGVPDLTDLTDRVEAIASSVGDIDTALDAIIAIQESLIGGDTE
jgi:hypothetical protein